MNRRHAKTTGSMRRVRSWLLAAALGATLLAACGGRSDWQELAVREGGFSVLMRGQPQYAKQQLATPAGKVPAHLYSSSRGESFFAVGYSDFPLAQIIGESPDALFTQVRETWVKRIDGRLVKSSPIKLSKQYPGIEFSAEGSFKGADTVVDARLYLVDQRLYQLISMGRKSEVPQGVVNRFLESFKLIEAGEGSAVTIKPPG